MCRALGLEWELLRDAVSHLASVPGRLERIDEGQSFSVIVDYAYEPAALNAVYESLKLFAHKKIIHVVGSAGGGRDVARREILGEMSAAYDDITIVTNEDPYDDDPVEIITPLQILLFYGKKNRSICFVSSIEPKRFTACGPTCAGWRLVLITEGRPVMAVTHGKDSLG